MPVAVWHKNNAFTLTPQQWIRATDAIGIVSKSGRYGGTYAHSDNTDTISARNSIYIRFRGRYFESGTAVDYRLKGNSRKITWTG